MDVPNRMKLLTYISSGFLRRLLRMLLLHGKMSLDRLIKWPILMLNMVCFQMIQLFLSIYIYILKNSSYIEFITLITSLIKLHNNLLSNLRITLAEKMLFGFFSFFFFEFMFFDIININLYWCFYQDRKRCLNSSISNNILCA